ncbi:MAG: translation initiation factor IF-2 [Desulfobacteraceae bacterium]|nr:MAG: translation initiation factor IF-2 [Desulfobacteraceae bacterium]
MAKIRVYELAKQLNMDSKLLADKLIAAGLPVKNHNSTLDEDTVKKAKEVAEGSAVVREVIEEERVKPNVIRRRKKITIEQEPQTAFADTAQIPPSQPPEAVQEEAELAPPIMETETEPPSEKTEPITEPVLPVTTFEETPQAVEDKEEIHDEMPSQEPPVLIMPKQPSLETVLEPIKEPAEEIEQKVPEQEVQVFVEPVKTIKDQEHKPISKKGKKKRFDQPAKIIKRPEEGPLKHMISKEPEQPVETPQPPPPIELEPKSEAVPVIEEEPKQKPIKKKEKKRLEEKDMTPRAAARRIKKEVYEKADLYEGRELRRKDKKSAKKPKDLQRKTAQTEPVPPKPAKRKMRIGETVAVSELARAMGAKGSEVIRKLLSLGVVATLNQSIDFETAALLADDFGYELERDTFEESRLIKDIEDREEDLKPRPPVVTIMGHVDHGKTSLLDFIRHSNIAGGEFGGITQHIGAYYVKTDGGDIVFLDTPGHEAFTAMRARGAKITDLIVLVVAADDGVMQQTKEAINHARAASIPIVVAINKIDKPEANPERVKRELAELNFVPEEWGGDTIFGSISAKTGQGVDDLLNLILLQAEMLELKANPNKPARGSVVEARLDKSKGPIVTVLVRNGTLKQGDHFICGDYFGRVRAMLNHRGKRMVTAGPSVPVEVYGISGVPMAGDELIVVQDEKTAKQIIDNRKQKGAKQPTAKRGLVSLDDLFEKIKEGEVKELNIVVKSDVQGTMEALSDSLRKLSTDEVKVKIIHAGTGGISESDIMLASASGAIILGFNVRANPRVAELAEKEGVDIRYYDVIYNATKDIRLAMAGMLEPTYREKVIGHADIREVFKIPKIGAIAGCYVTDGHLERNSRVRLLRDQIVVFDGKITSLRRFKDDAKEVAAGYECGVGIDNFQDLKPGDVFEAYQLERVVKDI